MTGKHAYESIDYGYYDKWHGGLDGISEIIERHCNDKYGYGKYDVRDYDIDITINATIIVEEEVRK